MFKKISLLVVATMLTALTNNAPACTTAVVGPKASASGKALLWKQRDGGNPHNVLVYIPSSVGSFAFTGIFNASDSTRTSCWGGSNEKGFSLVNNLSFNVSEDNASADNGSILAKALKTCVTIDDFEALLRQTSLEKCSSNYACIDASGSGAYFEVAGGLLKRYDVPEDGWLVRTNYSLAGEKDDTSEFDRHDGVDRYTTANYLMERHKGKFRAEDLIDGLGRSYFNALTGKDALKAGGAKAIFDDGFIARPTTVSSICIEGTDLMWVAIGCTPDSFSVPVLVSSGDNIPEALKASEADGLSPACEFSLSLNKYCHLFPRDANRRYLDVKKAKSTLAVVRKYESAAMKLGRKYYLAPTPPSKNDIAEVNRNVAILFEEFKQDLAL